MCYSYVCTDNLFDVKELDLTVVAKGYIVTNNVTLGYNRH